MIIKIGDKVFTKKKTKLNLYKERINLYNNNKAKLLSNLDSFHDEDNYKRPSTERSLFNAINNDSYSSIRRPNYKRNYKYSIEPSSLIEETIEEEVLPYKSKSIERRNLRNNNDLMHISVNDEYPDEEEEEEQYPIEPIYNRYPYESRLETEDKNNLVNLMNLDKTYSSIDDLTSNHFTLIEESNEIRKPANYTNKSILEDKIRKNRLKDLLSPSIDTLINNNSLQNISLTDKKARNNRFPQNTFNNDLDVYNNTSKSQKYRNRNKLKTFTVSIPLNNSNDDNLEYDVKYNNYNPQISKLKMYNKITPKKNKSYFYSTEDKNTNEKTNKRNRFENMNNSQYFGSSPSNDYYINWEEGNSICSRIIKNEPNNEKNNSNYLNLTNDENNKREKFLHNKSRSAFYSIPKRKKYYDDNNRRKVYDISRKKLFY